jgi:hypothetical protein
MIEVPAEGRRAATGSGSAARCGPAIRRPIDVRASEAQLFEFLLMIRVARLLLWNFVPSRAIGATWIPHNQRSDET